jgi:hypothetical protein
MVQTLVRCAIVIGIISHSNLSYAQDQATIVRVQDQTQIGGLAGIVLLMNPGNIHYSKAFITDVNGQASISRMDCKICTITAFDPQHLFYDKSIEFDSRSTSVTLILRVRPIIDRIGIPGSIRVNLVVYGSSGEPLSDQNVVIRPTMILLGADEDYNRVITDTTDSNGLVLVGLIPGKYIVATIIDGKPWEITFEIFKSKIQCRTKARNCINPSFRPSPPTQNVEAHLLAVNPISE